MPKQRADSNTMTTRTKISVLKSILLVVVVLTGLGCSLSAETLYYRMTDSSAGNDGIAFYIPPASDAMPVNPPDGQVRNVIFCIGDGMGFNHVALARHYGAGDKNRLYMELLPVRGEVTTHSADKAETDSAAAATAMACGVKTNNGMIGMTPDETSYSSILELLRDKGWRTGLTATSGISHATPASFASHVDSRDKEKEIAVQLLGSRVDVMLGGGRKYWTDELFADAKTDGYQVIETRSELAQVKPGPVIGLFADDGMTTVAPEPSLAEMSKAAINLLSTPSKEWFAPKPKFFLMIEGSQIDWASHANDTERTVRQTLLFDMAVREVIEFAQSDGHTLVIVTADHDTGGLKLKPGKKTGQLKAKWTSGDHTAANVPIYAYGPGADQFAGVLDNTDIAKRIAKLTGIKTFPVQRNVSQTPSPASVR